MEIMIHRSLFVKEEYVKTNFPFESLQKQEMYSLKICEIGREVIKESCDEVIQLIAKEKCRVYR